MCQVLIGLCRFCKKLNPLGECDRGKDKDKNVRIGGKERTAKKQIKEEGTRF